MALGREILEKELRRYDLTLGKVLKSGVLAGAAAGLGVKSADDVLAAVGYGKLSAAQVAGRLLPTEEVARREERQGSKIRQFVRKTTGKRADESVRIGGVDAALTRFAQCCNPVPGDRIVGFITRGRGVTVHTRDCPNVEQMAADPERMIAVDWDLASTQSYPVRLHVEGHDKPGLLAAVSGAIAEAEVSIAGAKVTTAAGGAVVEVEIEIRDLAQLRKVMGTIRRIKGVSRVERVRSFTAEKGKSAG